MINKTDNKDVGYIKNISDSCIEFRLNNLFISDNDYIYLAPDEKFCRTCFNRRHLTQVMGAKKVTAHINENTLNFARMIDVNVQANSLWHVYVVQSRQFATSFTFIPYEDCPDCSNQKKINKSDASAVYKNMLVRPENTDLTLLVKQIFSFGFARARSCSGDIGLNNSELNKLMADNVQARIIYRIITNTGQFTDESSLGLSTDKKMAELKAIMEYIERYAFFLHVARLPSTEIDDDIIDQFLHLYRIKATDTELLSIRSKSCWGMNLSTNEVRAIPLSFIYNNNQVSFIHPSTSGFGAHTDYKKSLCSSLLELAERDAFVRFWHDPELSFNFTPDTSTKLETNKLISILETVIENKEMESKFYILQSPLRLPVVLITISSNNMEKPPSLNFGIGVGYNFDEAVSSALEELRLNTVNLVKGISVIDGFLSNNLSGDINSALGRMSLYSSSTPRRKLKFLDSNNPLPDGIYENTSLENLEGLITRFDEANIDIYGINCTPECFQDKNVYVTRAFSPQLYPLQFSNEDVFNLPTGKLSAKNDLPHFFI